MKRTVFINWGLGDHYGWGVFGLNLMFWGLKHPRFAPVPLKPLARYYQAADPLMQLCLASPPQLAPKDGDVMLSALGNVIEREPVQHKMTQVGVSFYEVNPLPPEHRAKLQEFDGILAGSLWNHRALQAQGIRSFCAPQGVDTELFRPQTKRLYTDRFVVFSAGQLAYRKGQDLVVKAFSHFAQKHADSLLITAWRSPWERETAPSLNMSRVCQEFRVAEDMHAAIVRWATDNGIPPQQFLALPAFGNSLMPEVLRHVDLALFTSRCEGGTNLIAMEALACGVRCALSANTGHLDIIMPDNCVPLRRQTPGSPSARMLDWGDSDIDEIVDVLERGYAGRLPLDRDRIRDSMYFRTWEQAIETHFDQIEAIEQSPRTIAMVPPEGAGVPRYEDALAGFVIERLREVSPDVLPAAARAMQEALGTQHRECAKLVELLISTTPRSPDRPVDSAAG